MRILLRVKLHFDSLVSLASGRFVLPLLHRRNCSLGEDGVAALYVHSFHVAIRLDDRQKLHAALHMDLLRQRRIFRSHSIDHFSRGLRGWLLCKQRGRSRETCRSHHEGTEVLTSRHEGILAMRMDLA